MKEWTWVCTACGRVCLRLRDSVRDDISHCCKAKVRAPLKEKKK